MGTLGTLARIVLRWAGNFVLFRSRAVGGVLVERKEFGVFDDGEFVRGERRKLGFIVSQ